MINNTHYNIIDALIFAMGKEKLATLYSGWNDNMTIWEYAQTYSIPSTVASVLVECFEFADQNNWKPWTR